jgi:hypothetical protein
MTYRENDAPGKKIYLQCEIHFEYAPKVLITQEFEEGIDDANKIIKASEAFMRNLLFQKQYLAGKAMINTNHISWMQCKILTGVPGEQFELHEANNAWAEKFGKSRICLDGGVSR